MDHNFITRETVICAYACDKYYFIEYDHYGHEQVVKGFLLNYYGGNIVLLSEDGIYHIKYKDIVFMKPINNPPLDRFSVEYQKVLKTLQVDNT